MLNMNVIPRAKAPAIPDLSLIVPPGDDPPQCPSDAVASLNAIPACLVTASDRADLVNRAQSGDDCYAYNGVRTAEDGTTTYTRWYLWLGDLRYVFSGIAEGRTRVYIA